MRQVDGRHQFLCKQREFLCRRQYLCKAVQATHLNLSTDYFHPTLPSWGLSRLRRDRRCDRPFVPTHVERRGPQDPLQRDRKERRRHGDGALVESGLIGVPLPAGAIKLPGGGVSIPPSSVPSDQRLIVSQVIFDPATVRTRGAPITVRVKVVDTRGYLVRDVVVFVRSTPRVTSGSRLLTAQDGWMTRASCR